MSSSGTNPDEAGHSVIGRVARLVSGRYARLVWWADPRDLEQEAWATLLRAVRTFDPTRGVPLSAYLWRAAVLGLRAWCWAHSAPVCEVWGRREELAGVVADPLDDGIPSPAPSPEDEVEILRWRVAVDLQVHEAAEGDPQVLKVLLCEERPAGIASGDVARRRLYKALARARERIAASEPLHQLWKEQSW